MHNSALFPIVLSASTFLSYSALAACTANPDCAALGYTKTSCASGDLVIKCPFDTAKVQCIPQTCETIGKKTCGDICIKGNCCSNTDCAVGQLCDNYSCRYCAVGDIYYSDKTCSPDLISGKIPIGVVGKISNGGKNGLVAAKVQSSSSLYWAKEYEDLSCISNASGSSGGANDPTYNPNVRADRNGKSNTACIMTRVASSGTGKYPAGEYCNGLSVEGVTGWYLPAGGELYDVIVTNLRAVNTGLSKISASQAIPTSRYYWSSSEYAGYPNYRAWILGSSSGDWNYNDKASLMYQVRCVLAF